MNLTVVCAKCKFNQFQLQALNITATGKGDIRMQCVRCGSDQAVGIDLVLNITLPVTAMAVEPSA